MTNTNKRKTGAMTMADFDRAMHEHMKTIPQIRRTSPDGYAVRVFAAWLMRQYCRG